MIALNPHNAGLSFYNIGKFYAFTSFLIFKIPKKSHNNIPNHKPQTTNHKPQTTNHKPQTTNHTFDFHTFKLST
jgi:hypothetical protein